MKVHHFQSRTPLTQTVIANFEKERNMPILIQILLVILVLSFPFVFFKIYLNSIERSSKQILESQIGNSSEMFKDLKVWTKNFDVLKKKSKFDINTNQTNYTFNDCDLILNTENFVVIGKTKIFGKQRLLTPTIFEFGNNQKVRVVKIKNIQKIGADLEIEFIDSSYLNSMTLVIKRIDNNLKDKLLHCELPCAKSTGRLIYQTT